eukprot:m.100486 g.100486  ORF g.100486 m.100486 type:complete len:69 (+) comp15401_c0_seq2:124-330(+)
MPLERHGDTLDPSQGNPVADCKSYWLEILARFTGRGESSWGTLIIDDHTPTQKHKAKIESLRRAQPHH